jgi:hypothetical protein
VSIDRALIALFTAKAPAVPVALCRIGLGIAAFGRSLKTTRDLHWLAGDPLTVPARVFSWAPVIDTRPEILLAGGVPLAASLALTLGYRARSAAALFAVSTAFLYVLDQNFWAHHMYFLGLMTLLLSLTDSDAALSLRSLRGDGQTTVIAWPVFLMKVQLSLVYFFTSPDSFRRGLHHPLRPRPSRRSSSCRSRCGFRVCACTG